MPDRRSAPRGPGLVFALVGAESTGKSTLAASLAQRLASDTGLHCTWVPEALRQWCNTHQRTPQRHEQADIAQLQSQAIAEAQATHDVVIADTTPLMTAVYHWQVFGSAELDAAALQWQRQHCALTLLTGLDLPWVADGFQREGPQVREPVDARLRHLLLHSGLSFGVVRGMGPARLEAALDAVSPLLRTPSASKAGGLFSRLAQRDANAPPWPWLCDCDSPECEHALRSMQLAGQAVLRV
ncbi:MAG: ATPase [Ideonella sp. MAG2]|nr:MAG: ATPase [Ideonella sp. MAG2]